MRSPGNKAVRFKMDFSIETPQGLSREYPEFLKEMLLKQIFESGSGRIRSKHLPEDRTYPKLVSGGP